MSFILILETGDEDEPDEEGTDWDELAIGQKNGQRGYVVSQISYRERQRDRGLAI
ncbi:MAG: hypothetical protein P4M11_06680 [Candidatus Pacebacteria bacterium]|nr:hypothetical protein [Candidatus Paceibacterota bacterium]